MRILFDARWIFPEISGIGRYTQELLRHLLLVDRQNEYVLLFDRQDVLERTARDIGFSDVPNARAELLPWGPFAPASQLLLPRRLRAERAQVYHAPNYMIPYVAFPRRRGGALRCVVTLHDLIPLLFPQYTPRALKTRFLPVFRRVMRETGARADWILTPSAHTRRDVIDCLGLPSARADRVVAIPEGVGEQYRPAPERARTADAPGGPEILYVGRFDPYKNVGALVEALPLVLRRVPQARLRIIGAPDARYPEAPARARALGVDHAIVWSGYARPEELLDAYRRAAVFALPSRYEGFGLPVLEAMACGTPVVCGNASSLPEVAGDAAQLVDPDDIPGLAEALVRVLIDPALAEDYRRRGLERAARFTWTRTAEETLAIYRKAAEG